MESYSLKGSVGEINQMQMIVLLRKHSGTKRIELRVFIDGNSGLTLADVDQKLAALTLPFPLGNGHGPLEDPETFEENSNALMEKNTPFIMLEIGKSEQTQQEIIVLNVVNGITLRTAIGALREMSLRIKGKSSEQQS